MGLTVPLSLNCGQLLIKEISIAATGTKWGKNGGTEISMAATGAIVPPFFSFFLFRSNSQMASFQFLVIDLCVGNDKCPWDPAWSCLKFVYSVVCTVFYICVSRHVDCSVASGQLSS